MRQKKWLCAIASMSLLMTFIPAHEIKVTKAAEKADMKQLWYETDDYPITTETEKNYDYGMEDMFDILNPPRELLDSYSSEKLADLMLKYPYLWVLPSYDYEERQTFFGFVRNSDVYNELMARDDGVKSLLDAYRNTNVDIDLLNSDPYIIWQHNQIVNAEIFGCQFINFSIETFSKEEQELANQIKEEKQELYAGLLYDDTKLYLSFKNEIIEQKKDIIDIKEILNQKSTEYGFTAMASPITKSVMSTTIWFTPGTYHKYSVYSNCLKWYSNDYTTTQRNQLDASITNPNWIMIAHSSPKYNCHSFAWIWQSTSNDFWLDSPSAYMGSSEISYVGHNITPMVGDKIVYFDNDTNAIKHSAVVISTPAGKTGTYVRSKFGGKALYDAPHTEVADYYHANLNYNVYR